MPTTSCNVGEPALVRCTRALLLVVVLLLVAPAPARSGNLDSFFQGDEAALTGGAVVSTISDASAVWYNPAGLGANRRSELQATGTVLVLELRDVTAGIVVELPESRSALDLSATMPLVVPSALVLARQVREGLSFGLGLFVSEQDLVDIGGRLNERGPDGQSLFQLAEVRADDLRYHLGGGLGWQVSPALSLGVSLFGVFEEVDRRSRLAFDITDPRTDPDTRAALVSESTTLSSRVAGELVLGLQWRPLDALHIGVALRSPRLMFTETFEGDGLSVSGAVGADNDEQVAFRVDEGPRDPAGSGLIAPLRGVVGVAWSTDSGFVAVEVDYSPSLQNDDVAIELDDVWNVRLGGLLNLSERLAAGVGLFTDLSQERPTRDPLDAQIDFYGVATGIRLHNPVQLAEGEPAPDLVFSTTLGLRYAIGVGDVRQLVIDLSDAVGAPESASLTAGEAADILFHELSLHIGTAISF